MLPLLLSFQMAQAEASPVLKKALHCKQQLKCVYFGELYAGDAPFRHALHAALRDGGVSAPRWLGKGVMTPMLPLRVGGDDYLLGSVCEPHNCPHQLRVLYQPGKRQLLARYSMDDGSERWFGQPSAQQKALLQDEYDPNSPLKGKLTGSTLLPLVLP